MQATKSKRVIFLLPLAVLLFATVSVEVSASLFELRWSWIPAFLAYYFAIEMSLLFANRKLQITIPGPIWRFTPRLSWNRLIFGGVFPAVLPLGFFVLNVRVVRWYFLVFIVVFALINPYFEETFWRGLLSFLPAGNKVTILYSASLFGFSHYFLWGAYWLANPPGKWIAAVVTTFIMGILWMWFYKREQKLIYTILSHILVDIFNLSVAMFYGVKMVTI